MCSCAQLLHAMHLADPSLVCKKFVFKLPFTLQKLGRRVTFSQDSLPFLASPALLLQNIIFIDEASIVTDKYTRSDVYVWCDKHDLSCSDVCPRPLPKEGSVTARSIVTASAP